MEPGGINIQSFSAALEELLDRLRREIHLESRAGYSGCSDLDNYLLDINTFYYRSFLEHYLPLYEQRWREEVRDLLQLSQQQGVLETNVLSTLKRYTRLYNLLKTLLAGLSQFSQVAEQETFLIQQEVVRQGSELDTALTGLRHQLHSLHLFFEEAGTYLDDGELMGYLREYPGYGAALQGDFVNDHRLARVTSEIAYLIGILDKSDRTGPRYWGRVAEDMEKHIEHLKDALVNRDDREQARINPILIDELVLLKAALGDCYHDAALGSLIRRRLNGWHKVLQLQALPNRNLFSLRPDFILSLVHLVAEDVWEAARDVDSACQQLDQIIASFAGNPEASYQTLVQIREWLGFWSPFMRSMSTDEGFQQVPPLHALLHEVQTGILFVNNQMSLIDTLRHRWAYSLDQAEGLSHLASEQLGLLQQLKNDLERLLAPRNIARTWKDMGVRLLKLPLQKGQVFPQEYSHLLEQARIEIRTDASQPDLTILHEEGDLFLIKVLNSEQTEIPYMVITRKP